MQPLRLALIAHRFQPNDGQGRVNFEVAKRLAAGGHHLTLLTADCTPELAEAANVSLVHIGNDRLPSQLLRDLAFARDSSAWIRRHRAEYDVIQANGFTTWEPCDLVTAHFVHTAWARSPWYPFRAAWTLNNLYQRVFTRLNSFFELLVFRRAAAVIAVSDAVAAEVEALGIAHSKVRVVYNGVDVNEYRPGLAQRNQFGLPEDVPLALFAGDIRTTRKNLDTTLLALERIPGLHLAVAGETDGSPFPQMAQRLGLQQRVHFLGKITAMPMLMRSVDLFVFPSRYEAHPLVVLEAMASGLPAVLAATVGSVSSFGECFRVLQDPGDADGLAGLIQDLLAHPEQRKALGDASRARALTLSWDRTAEHYLTVYRAVSARHEPVRSLHQPALVDSR